MTHALGRHLETVHGTMVCLNERCLGERCRDLMEVDQRRKTREMAPELRQQIFADPCFRGLVVLGPVSRCTGRPCREGVPAAERYDLGGMPFGILVRRILERRKR